MPLFTTTNGDEVEIGAADRILPAAHGSTIYYDGNLKKAKVAMSVDEVEERLNEPLPFADIDPAIVAPNAPAPEEPPQPEYPTEVEGAFVDTEDINEF